MSKIVFPYGIRFREDSRVEVFPAAEIFVAGKRGGGIRALFHIDSGATTSVMPASDGTVLGVRLLSGKPMLVRGITGDVLKGYRQTVVMHFGNVKGRVPVIFVESAITPRILGREGIFSRFGILFYEARRRVTFFEVRTERKILETI